MYAACQAHRHRGGVALGVGARRGRALEVLTPRDGAPEGSRQLGPSLWASLPWEALAGISQIGAFLCPPR
jgi:hypothetical protein